MRVPSSTVECLERLDRLGAEQFFVLFQAAPFIADDVEGAVLVECQPDPLLRSAQCADPCRRGRRRARQGALELTPADAIPPSVEGTHSELSSRFPDRLSGNDSDCFALTDH